MLKTITIREIPNHTYKKTNTKELKNGVKYDFFTDSVMTFIVHESIEKYLRILNSIVPKDEILKSLFLQDNKEFVMIERDDIETIINIYKHISDSTPLNIKFPRLDIMKIKTYYSSDIIFKIDFNHMKFVLEKILKNFDFDNKKLLLNFHF